MSSEFKTVKEVAQDTGISERYLRELCDQGRIPGAVKRGRDWHIPVSQIERLKREVRPR